MTGLFSISIHKTMFSVHGQSQYALPNLLPGSAGVLDMMVFQWAHRKISTCAVKFNSLIFLIL